GAATSGRCSGNNGAGVGNGGGTAANPNSHNSQTVVALPAGLTRCGGLPRQWPSAVRRGPSGGASDRVPGPLHGGAAILDVEQPGISRDASCLWRDDP